MERVDLLVKNGTVVLREGARLGHVAIDQGKIAAILPPNFTPDAAQVIDATGKHVMPGVVDPEGHPGHSFPLDLDYQTERSQQLRQVLRHGGFRTQPPNGNKAV
jgi:dihydroorotase-like cyclic amidohydrolase